MKKRRGRRLILETVSSSDGNRDGPVVAGIFPSAIWAFLFQHFEDRVPPKVAIEDTSWRGFRNWHDAERWLEETA